jgi:hypothetical protein
MTKLDLILLPTYNTNNLAIRDVSEYSPNISNLFIYLDIPSYGLVDLPFDKNEVNVFTSSMLGISNIGVEEPLPDGIYRVRLSVVDGTEMHIDKTFFKVDKLQEKFDTLFMNLDMMECNQSVKKQSKEQLNSIFFYIQGAIAAANNCAEIEAMNLYKHASKLLLNMSSNNCGCN